MKYSTVIIIIFLLILLFEWQMIDVQNENRREKCKIVIVDGVMHKATDYEYYNCISK